jgi:hypothetical protein
MRSGIRCPVVGADPSSTCFDVCVFEFELQSWRAVRLRVGRWHFRTWPSFFMLLPRGNKPSIAVWAVQIDVDDVDGPRTVQLGAFTDERVAQSCVEALEQEGRSGLYLNMISVHARLEDWRWDR